MKTIVPHIRPASSLHPETAARALSPSSAAGRAVEVRIDELVLHGFGRGEAEWVAAGLRQELTRLVATEGLPQLETPTAVERRAAGAIRVAAKPETTGVRAARAIYRSLRE